MAETPFIGLRPYTEEDSDIFAGRGNYIDKLSDYLTEHKFITVSGTSGAGKSSLIRAGLVPRLRLALGSEANNWRVAMLRPGRAPFLETAKALLIETETDEKKVLRDEYLESFPDPQPEQTLATTLQQDQNSLKPLVDELLPENFNLLIVVDQFEELFRYTKDKSEVEKFITWLLSAKEHQKVYVLITIRSEFLETDCANYPPLINAINGRQFGVPALEPAQIRETIEIPPQQFDGQVEKALIKELLKDIDKTKHSDQLPLLQYTLMRMWLHFETRSKKLTCEYYKELGGLQGALQGSAKMAYQDLDEKQQNITKILFQNITHRGIERHPDGSYEYNRHPTPLKEIAEKAEVSYKDVIEVIEVFRHAYRRFLLPPLNEPLNEDSIVDITHESLIRQWAQLRGWVDEEGDNADLYKRLENASRHFPREASLWRGPELRNAIDLRKRFSSDEQFKHWAKRYGRHEGKFFTQAFGFLESSRKQQRHEEKLERRRNKQAKWAAKEEGRRQAELEQVHRDEERAKKEAKRNKKFATILGVTAFIAVVAGIGVFIERQRIASLETQRTEQLFASHRVHSALAAQTQKYAQASDIIHNTYRLEDAVTVPSLIHSRNLLSRLLEITSGKPQGTLQADSILLDVAVSPNGKFLVTTGENGFVAVFDIVNSELIRQRRGHQGEVRTVVFSPDGQWFATAGEDKQIILWELNGQKKAVWSTKAKIEALAISPDGQRIASAEQEAEQVWKVLLWSVENGRPHPLKTQATAEISGLAFSPDGQQLAIASGNNAEIWQLNSDELLHTLTGHTGEVQRVAFSPNGQQLATSSNDKTIRLWQVATGKSLDIPLTGHHDKVYGVRFLSNDRLVSTSENGELRIWDVKSGITLRVLQGHTASCIAVAHHEKLLFSAGNDGTVRIWETDLPFQYLHHLSEELAATAFSPDNQTVAIGTAEGKVQLYTVPGAELLVETTAHSEGIQRLAFSANGQYLASASLDHTAKVWKVKQNQLHEHVTIQHEAGVNNIIFTPDNKQVITAVYGGEVGITTLHTGLTQRQKIATDQDINTVALDRTGQTLLIVADKKLQLWDFSKFSDQASEPRQTFSQNNLLWGTLSNDAHYIAGMGRDSKIKVHSAPFKPMDYQELSGHNNSIWKGIFSPNNQQLITGSADATLRFWDLLPRKEFKNNELLFTLPIPAKPHPETPFYDFDFQCTEKSGCWLSVPLTNGRLMLYDLGNIYTTAK